MEISADILKLAIVCLMILGVLYCFFGYRFFKIALGITGFIIGSLITQHLTLSIFEGRPTVALISSIAGGLIISATFIFIYFVGVFFMGASLGGLLGLTATAFAEGVPWMILVIIMAAVGGGLALLFQKHVIIISTAFSGAGSIVCGAWYLARGFGPATLVRNSKAGGGELYAFFGCCLLITALGMLVQYKVTGRKTKLIDKKDD